MADDPVRILVVDDDVALLGVMEACLQSLPGSTIVGVGAGPEALTSLRSDPFDVVVTDYSLGSKDVDGLSILKLTQDLYPDALGIMVTAFASLEVSLQAIRLGAYDFLTKPFQIDELRLTVGNACDRVRLVRKNEGLERRIEELTLRIEAMEEGSEARDDDLDRRPERSGQTIALGSSARRDRGGPEQAYRKAGQQAARRTGSQGPRPRDEPSPPEAKA